MNTYYTPFGNQNDDEMYRRTLYYQTKARQERKEIRKLGNIMGCAVLAFVVVQLISSTLLVSSSTLYAKYESSSIFQNSFGIICVEVLAVAVPFAIMALCNKNKYKVNLIPAERVGFGKGFLWVGFGMLCCIGADYIVAVIMAIAEQLGYELTQGEVADPDNPFACVIAVVATAVVPAVCEEFAMRCCSLGLLRNYGKAFGVVSVSIVFGLLHGNVIQFVFAGLVGLILGYVTIKTGSIIPAIFIHGFNNGMSALATVLVYAFGEKADEVSTYVFFGFWLAVGVICTIVLALKKQLGFRLDEKNNEPFANSLSQKIGAFVSSPVLIISCIYLIFSTVLSIEKM